MQPLLLSKGSNKHGDAWVCSRLSYLAYHTDCVLGNRPGIFNQQASGSVWADGEDPSSHARHLAAATGGASTTSSKANHLAELFQPPFELMSNMPWDAARDQGKDDEKWLLVN